MSTTCDHSTGRSSPLDPATRRAVAKASKPSTSRTRSWLDFLASISKNGGKIVRIIRGSRLGAAFTLEERRFLEPHSSLKPARRIRMIVPSSVAVDRALLRRREESVARGVATTHPLFLDRGEGAVVWDVDGRRYIDFVGGIGTLNTGHANPAIVAAIAKQAARLTHACFQVAMYEPYVAVAEALNARVPGPSPKKTLLLSTGA